MDIKPDERKAAKKGEAWRGERAACRGKTERVYVGGCRIGVGYGNGSEGLCELNGANFGYKLLHAKMCGF